MRHTVKLNANAPMLICESVLVRMPTKRKDSRRNIVRESGEVETVVQIEAPAVGLQVNLAEPEALKVHDTQSGLTLTDLGPTGSDCQLRCDPGGGFGDLVRRQNSHLSRSN